MAGRQVATASETADNEALAAELKAELPLARIAVPFMLTTCVAMWLLFHGSANPQWPANLWFAITMMMMSAGMFIAWRFQRATAAEAGSAARLRRFVQFLRTLIMLMMAAAPWVMMNEATPTRQTLGLAMIPFFLAMMQYGAINLQVRTGAYPLPAPSVVIAAVSTAAFATSSDLPDALPWAAFLLLSGFVLFISRNIAHDTVAAELDRRVAVETAAAGIRQALAVAAAEREAKARFIASASHDLKQPLSAAQLWARICMDAAPGPARSESMAKAEQAFAAATGLVDSMIDHMRLEAGAEVARIKPVPIGSLLLASAGASAPAAAAINMQIRAVSSSLTVGADPALLGRAIDNLVANAIRHSGGRRLLLGARRDGDSVVIWAIDDGRGVAPADRDELFDDYAQGAEAGPGGFGIGLASVRRQLALMGGEAALDPRWTRGAAFRLRLPLVQPVCAGSAA